MNGFIKKLFASGGRPIAGRKLTTHSMKATGLSWCAKLGVQQEHRAILARHATSVQGATVLYSRDLLSSALRSFVGVLDAIRGQVFHPDKSRSGMITPARVTPVGWAWTPFPMQTAATAMDGHASGVATPVLAGTVQPAPDRAEGHGPDIQLDVEPGLDDLFSPGTPVDSPNVKQEFSWPDASWSEAVIDLDGQQDLAGEWQSGSEEESSDCSSSSNASNYEWAFA